MVSVAIRLDLTPPPTIASAPLREPPPLPPTPPKKSLAPVLAERYRERIATLVESIETDAARKESAPASLCWESRRFSPTILNIAPPPSPGRRRRASTPPPRLPG